MTVFDAGGVTTTRPAERPRPAPVAALIAALIFGAAVVALYAGFYSRVFYPFNPDSASYIEAARSLLAGNGLLMAVPYGWAAEMQVLRLWPPGYPLLIAFGSLLGLEPAEAALWLTRGALALLPAAIFWAVRPATGTVAALAAAALSSTSLGLVANAHIASTDAILALLAALSFGALLRGLTGRPRYLALAGFAAGLAVTMRNAALALVLAEGATLLVMAGARGWRSLLRQGALVAAGAAPAVLPLLLWNWLAFGTLTAYAMPPSTRPWLDNLHDAIFALAYGFLPMFRIADLAATHAMLTASGLVIALALLVWMTRRAAPEHRILMLFAACYVLLGTAMLVVARSRYEWGELISYRHLSQHDVWLAIAIMAGVMAWHPRRGVLIGLVASAAIVLGLRVVHLAQDYRQLAATQGSTRNARLAMSTNAQIDRFIAGIPADCAIVSNLSEVISVTHRRWARFINEDQARGGFERTARPTVFLFARTRRLSLDDLRPAPALSRETFASGDFVAYRSPDCR